MRLYRTKYLFNAYKKKFYVHHVSSYFRITSCLPKQAVALFDGKTLAQNMVLECMID